jgi:hypothetical protein
MCFAHKWKGDGDVVQKNIGFAGYTSTVFGGQRPIKHK